MRNNVVFDLMLLILWVVVIFAVSSIPGQLLSSIQNAHKMYFVRKFISDPVMHFFEYSVLAFLLARFCSNYVRGFFGLLYIIGGGVFIAFCDEFYQYKITKRAFEIKDLLMDFFGIIAIVLIMFSAKVILI